MSVATSFLLLFLYFLPYSFAGSCSNSKFTCANLTMDIRYPFFTKRSQDCHGVYLIQCINLTPTIQFPGQEFMYPVVSISYPERTLIIHDLKLSLSLYPWGADCVFLYNFKAPIPHVNVTHLSLLISSGQPLFSCGQKDYRVYQNIFYQLYNASLCKDYDLYYTYASSDSQQKEGLPAPCSSSGLFSFSWKLLFSEDQRDGGNFSLLSVGFSRNWRNWTLQLDCFDCRVAGDDCRSGDDINSPACKCSQVCRGITDTKKKTHIIIGLITGVGVFLFVCLQFFLYLCWHKRMYSTNIFGKKNSFGAQTIEAAIGKYESLSPKRYKYSDVKKITKSFHDKIGQGGYGIVFKGSLKDGRLVAVKVLNDSKENGAEFINEVSSIGWTSHVNVVSLLGFCFEGSKRALIYEFMQNGSLEKYIYSEKAKSTLGWENLYQIAIGIARGLEYLHHRCNTRMVHFDIKPQNILLDNEFCPKISDFGLAKLCSPKDSKLSMPVPRGTIGYIAPEVLSRSFGVASSKSDVYSYGMVVLDMVGARNNKNARVENTSETYFPDWIYSHLEQDGDLEAWGVTNETQEIAKKLILVGLWCIQTLPRNRPSMSMVIEMLEGSISDLKVPPKEYLSSTLESLFGTSSTWVSEDASGCM